MNSPRRLYRCRHDRVLTGVSAGIAEYLQIDPTVVRVLWILSALFGGISIFLYIILALVMPLEPADEVAGNGGVAEAGEPVARWQNPPVDRQPGRAGLYVGVILIVLGAIALVNVLLPGLIVGGAVWAGLLIAVGVALLVGSARPDAADR